MRPAPTAPSSSGSLSSTAATCRRPPALLARVDGELRAAVGVDGETLADPFHPTAEIVTLLRLAAEQEGELNRAA